MTSLLLVLLLAQVGDATQAGTAPEMELHYLGRLEVAGLLLP